jgi:hypothetical protein
MTVKISIMMPSVSQTLIRIAFMGLAVTTLTGQVFAAGQAVGIKHPVLDHNIDRQNTAAYETAVQRVLAEVPADDSGVNIFRMLLREYFGADLPDLPNRSYTWPDKGHIYDFRDVTDELPLQAAQHRGHGGHLYRRPLRAADYPHSFPR